MEVQIGELLQSTDATLVDLQKLCTEKYKWVTSRPLSKLPAEIEILNTDSVEEFVTLLESRLLSGYLLVDFAVDLYAASKWRYTSKWKKPSPLVDRSQIPTKIKYLLTESTVLAFSNVCLWVEEGYRPLRILYSDGYWLVAVGIADGVPKGKWTVIHARSAEELRRVLEPAMRSGFVVREFAVGERSRSVWVAALEQVDYVFEWMWKGFSTAAAAKAWMRSLLTNDTSIPISTEKLKDSSNWLFASEEPIFSQKLFHVITYRPV